MLLRFSVSTRICKQALSALEMHYFSPYCIVEGGKPLLHESYFHVDKKIGVVMTMLILLPAERSLKAHHTAANSALNTVVSHPKNSLYLSGLDVAWMRILLKIGRVAAVFIFPSLWQVFAAG